MKHLKYEENFCYLKFLTMKFLLIGGGGRRDHKYDNVNYRSLTTNWFADKPIQTNYEWRNHSYILSVTVTDVL